MDNCEEIELALEEIVFKLQCRSEETDLLIKDTGQAHTKFNRDQLANLKLNRELYIWAHSYALDLYNTAVQINKINKYEV